MSLRNLLGALSLLIFLQFCPTASNSEAAKPNPSDTAIAAPEKAQTDKPKEPPSGASPEATYDLLQLLKKAGSKKADQAK